MPHPEIGERMNNDAILEIEALLKAHQPEALEKIRAKLQEKSGDEGTIDHKLFFYLFAISARWFSKSPVEIDSASDWKNADRFNVIQSWQWPSFARLYLLLLFASKNTPESFIKLYDALFNASDVQESITLIQSLAFLPHSESLVHKAREAARSNITSLFCAVAHNSDYAFKTFDETGWNQLILKAAFLAVPIVSIHGLRERNNEHLVTMLCDYARERQAASRVVPWDLWCCVAWAADSDDKIQYLKDQFDKGDPKTKAAIALGLIENKNKNAQTAGHELSQQDSIKQPFTPLNWGTIANDTTA